VGFRRVGVRTHELPLADGGEGTVDALCSVFEPVETVDAFGRPRVARTGVLDDGTRVVEAAEAIPLDPSRLDAAAASSRGLGLWIAQFPDCHLVVAVGGTATMDAGAGLLEVLDRLPGPTRVLCDVATKLYDAPRLFGPQKGATPEQIDELEARFRRIAALAPFADVPGSGAAGGLGAAFASLGAELVPGADAVLDLLGFDPRPYDLVVTGEGRVDATTWEGKAPAAVARRCAAAGVGCVVFGGLVVDAGTVPKGLSLEPVALGGGPAGLQEDRAVGTVPEGLSLELVALSGEPARAREDLVELGERLGRVLAARGA
jgi:glycerate kinase